MQILEKPAKKRSKSQVEALLPVLRASSWVDELPNEVLSVEDALESLVAAIRTRRCRAGETLAHMGEEVESFFVVEEGSLERYEVREGRRFAMAKNPVLYSGGTAGQILSNWAQHTHTHTHIHPEDDHADVFEFDLVVGAAGATVLVIDTYEYQQVVKQ